jgi:glycosyltransferase involved in cell wall biosynthesis
MTSSSSPTTVSNHPATARTEITMPPRNRPANPRVSIVIPAKNEAHNLEVLLPDLPDVHETILVDGNSEDGTVDVARQIRPDMKVVRQSRSGKGNALACGFEAATGDVIVMFDADCSADPREIPRFVAALVAGADFAKGSRFHPGGGSADITRVRSAGNRALNVLANRMLGARYTDLCYGYNAFWARHLPAMDLDCSGFEIETLMNVRAARSGLRVREVPSYEHSRVHGVSNLRAMPDGWRILKVIIREWRDSRADGPPPAPPVRHVTRQGGSSC